MPSPRLCLRIALSLFFIFHAFACSHGDEPDPIPACEDDCPGEEPDPVQSDDATCRDIVSCVQRCGHKTCEEQCMENASALAILEYDDLDHCQRTYCNDLHEGGFFEHCMTQLCFDEQATCQGVLEAERPLAGDVHCDAVFECANRCDDMECRGACTEKGTLLARRQFAHLQQCLDTSCPTDPLSCAESRCRVSLHACLGPPQGDASCLEVTQCILACSGDACVRDCYASGTATAQESHVRLMDCSLLHCSNLKSTGEMMECHAQACADDFDACLLFDAGHDLQ
ncbi:MAG: hypothetical protein ACNA8W_21335 [Bradymonadaceae bacterium]